MKTLWIILMLFFVSACAPQEKTNYDIIKENVAMFEETPVAYFDLGYLVKVDGQYGFMDENGEYLFQPIYPSVIISEQDVLLQDVKHGVTVSIKKQEPVPFGGLGGIITSTYVYDQEKKEYGKVFMDGSYVKEDIDTSRIVYDKEDACKKGIHNLSLQADYYIYSKQNDMLYGPYDQDEYATYSYEQNKNPMLYFGLGPDYYRTGLFYEKVQNQYRIHSADDRKMSKDLFDEVTFLSSQSARVKANNKIGIVNKDAEVLYFDDCQDASEPIRNQTFIKKDNKWNLVRLKNQ